MSVLLWLLRGFLFVILLGLAIKNGGDVELRFYFDAAWQAPLSVVILVAVVVGVVFGLLALLPPLVRQRREIARLRQHWSGTETAQARTVEPPTPAEG